MSSEVQVCNLALTKIGESQIISLAENSKAARLCSLHYAPTRDAVLRSHIWNFAIKRVELALSTTTPAYDYSYQFAIPVDSLRILETNLSNTAEWKIENGFLLADSDAVKVRYLSRVTDPTVFDSLFTEALASRLAAELAVPLTDSITLSKLMIDLYASKIAEARTMDAVEGTPDNIEADAWLNARVGLVTATATNTA
tara:strand:- start:29 stop:622 length:594 start_codon:yes stop_codon:yes gene_type:complete